MRILLIRLRQIGDVVFTTPAIGALRRHFPDAHLTYLVEPAAAAVVAHHPDLHAVIVAPRVAGIKGTWADLRLGAALRRQAFDIAIDFHGGPRASLLTWLTGAPTRVGYDVKGRRWMYTRVVGRARELRPRHSVVNQWDLLGAIGIASPTPETDPVIMAIRPEAAARVAARLAASGITGRDQIIVMHVSAGNPFRRWPIESFAEVASRLVATDTARRVIVTSGPSETDAAARVVRLAGAATRGRQGQVEAWSDNFPLEDLRALLDHAALYIGGDSGPMHIAATSQVPMVSLYGPTLPARSAPWRAHPSRSLAVEVSGLECRPCDQRVCTPGDFRCLARIAPSEVIAAAEQLLARRP